MEDSLHRKLAVILHADVVGSTALVRLNETLAHKRIQDTFRRFSKTITDHSGIAHEIRGDALVAEFSRASDAISASLAFQATNSTHNEELPDEVRPAIRVGIAMGEVVVADNTVTGEGIVLAQRLEQLAEPGGVCVQGAAYETIPKRLPFKFENLGERELKGFDESVRVYAVSVSPGAEIPRPETQSLLGADVLDLSNKPSVAVLPFTNTSGDKEHEYFSDGISEDLITALCRIHSFSVMGRNSTFAYKDRVVTAQEVGAELGVRYVLEGSVRKGGKRVRVSAQLVDTETGNNVWADHYDRELEDFFALQDELTETIVGVIEPELSVAERARATRTPPHNLDAWGSYQQGLWHMFRFNREDNAQARRLLERAIELDSNLAGAYAGLAHVGYWDALLGYRDDREATLDHALEMGRKAAALDENDPTAHWALGSVYLLQGELDDCLAELEVAIRLNPSYAHAHYRIGFALALYGRGEESLVSIDKAIRLSPKDPSLWTFYVGRSLALQVLQRYEEAAEFASMAVRQSNDRNYWPLATLASALGHLGKTEKARAALDECLRLNPNFSDQFVQLKYKRPEDSERFFAGLRKAGFDPD